MIRMLNKIFPVGTRSLLFGVHQLFWHPITVYIAWCKLYGSRPTFQECICIIIHDWGYWGKKNMDGNEGETHPEIGAKIAKILFNKDMYFLVLLHSRHYSKIKGMTPSKLCWADKLSIVYEPAWFYILRARLSGEIKEYKKNSPEIINSYSDMDWLNWLKKQQLRQSTSNKNIYLTNTKK